MTTSLQVEANKRNARRSCGPRTPEGKARSCLNAVTHGLTARTLILPGEDAEEFERRLAAWTADVRSCNPFEEDLVRQAVGHSWRHCPARRGPTSTMLGERPARLAPAARLPPARRVMPVGSKPVAPRSSG